MRRPAPAVTFDLWHTLVYVSPSEEERYMRGQLDVATDVLARSPGVRSRPDRSRRTLRTAFRREYEAAVTVSRRGRSVSPAEQFERAARACGRRPLTELYLRSLRRLVATLRFRVAPGARPVLRALRRDGYRIGVLSNTTGEPGRYLRPALTGFGFDRLVDAYTFSDELPWSKPSPKIFGAALARLGSSPRAAVHVGDGWSDMEGGRRARLAGTVLYTGLQEYGPEYRRLFLAPNSKPVEGDRRVAELAAVPAIVRELLPMRSR